MPIERGEEENLGLLPGSGVAHRGRQKSASFNCGVSCCGGDKEGRNGNCRNPTGLLVDWRTSFREPPAIGRP